MIESISRFVSSVDVQLWRASHGSRQSVPRFFSVALALVSISVLPAGARVDQADNVAADLRAQLRSQPTGSVSVIVQLTHPVGAADHNRLQQLGGRIRTAWTIIPGYEADVPAAAVMKLAALPEVRRISPDRRARAAMDVTTRAVGVDVARATYGSTGNNVGIAVLDTGIQTGPELGKNLCDWADFVNGRSTPYDDNGHGTHVAGILSGTSQATIDARAGALFQGLVPKANLVALKVLGADGSGLVSRVIGGLNWVINHRNHYQIRVINLSLGHVPAESYTTDPLCQACESAVRAGIVVCVAAGNWGKDASGNTLYGGILSPGTDPCVITVGAVNANGTPARSDETICSYSSRGPTYPDLLAKPDLVAPGNRIISVRAIGSFLDANSPGNRLLGRAYGGRAGESPYFVLSGTSMATPVVSAAAAMVFEQNPHLFPNAVKALLMYSAQPLWLGLSDGLTDLTEGGGYLNTPAALEIATKIDPSAAAGSWWLRATLSGTTYLQGEKIPWAQRVLWDNNAVLGSIISYNHLAWGNNVAWGENLAWPSNVAWGENAVTSDPSWNSAAAWSDAPTWAIGPAGISTWIRGD